MSIKLDTIATESKIVASSLCGSDSNSGDKSENNDESLQETYEKMYTQWLKVCAAIRALGSENQERRNLKTKAEGMVLQLKALIVEKDEKHKSIATELERTQKC